MQIRVSKENETALKKVVKSTRRTPTVEANIALEQYLVLMGARKSNEGK